MRMAAGLRAIADAPTFQQQLPIEPHSLIATITSLLKTLNPKNPKIHPIQPNPSCLIQFSHLLSPNLVTQVIKSQTNPYYALFFFNWASNPSPNPNNYTPTHFCYIAITDVLLSHNLFSLAADLLRMHNRFSDFMIGKFIKAHADKGHINSAVKLFHQVRYRESGRCLFSYNAILGVLVRGNRFDLARNFYDMMIREGVIEPDVSTYTTMIRGFCKVGMVDDAQKMFDEMRCQPNMLTYNTLIDGFCKKGMMDSARRLLGRMMEMNGNFCPDTVTFTTLIDGYCKKGQLDDAKSCFDEMLERKCEPNVFTYNALINGLCLSGNVDEAKRMMTKMRLNGLKDNVSTHTTLLKGYSVVGRSDEVFQHFREMISLGMQPDVRAYGVVLKEYCKLGKPNEAINLLWETRARDMRLRSSCFNSVLAALINSGELDRAVLFLKQMPQMGGYPNFISYSTVVCGLVRAKRSMTEVQELVDDMLQNGENLDATLYRCLVQGYCQDGDEKKAMHFFKEMAHKGYVIDLENFSVFVEQLCAKGIVIEVEKLFEQMSNSCSTIDMGSYRRILDECLLKYTSN